MPIKMRQMAASDRPAINRLLKDTEAFSEQDVQIAMELVDAYLEDAENCGYFFIVAEEQDTLAGYFCYGPTPLTLGTWDYYWLATDKRHQHKGIASSLIKMAEEDIRSKQGRLLLIDTSSGKLYEPARNLFIRLNYIKICVIPDYYSIGDDRITYRKFL